MDGNGASPDEPINEPPHQERGEKRLFSQREISPDPSGPNANHDPGPAHHSDHPSPDPPQDHPPSTLTTLKQLRSLDDLIEALEGDDQCGCPDRILTENWMLQLNVLRQASWLGYSYHEIFAALFIGKNLMTLTERAAHIKAGNFVWVLDFEYKRTLADYTGEDGEGAGEEERFQQLRVEPLIDDEGVWAIDASTDGQVFAARRAKLRLAYTHGAIDREMIVHVCYSDRDVEWAKLPSIVGSGSLS